MRGKCVEFFPETFTKHVLLIDSLINARSHVRPQSELYKIFFNWDAPHCVKLIVNIETLTSEELYIKFKFI